MISATLEFQIEGATGGGGGGGGINEEVSKFRPK